MVRWNNVFWGILGRHSLSRPWRSARDMMLHLIRGKAPVRVVVVVVVRCSVRVDIAHVVRVVSVARTGTEVYRI